MKSLLLALSVGCASVSAGAEPRATTHDLFVAISSVMLNDPNISEMEVCLESQCETYSRTDIPRERVPMAADPSTPPGGGVADAVSEIIGSAAKSVGVGGRIVVDYEKKADGSVKVRVEASFGTGTGAAAGASASVPGISNPDNGHSL